MDFVFPDREPLDGVVDGVCCLDGRQRAVVAGCDRRIHIAGGRRFVGADHEGTEGHGSELEQVTLMHGQGLFVCLNDDR
jgi:hypothetical protein